MVLCVASKIVPLVVAVFIVCGRMEGVLLFEIHRGSVISGTAVRPTQVRVGLMFIFYKDRSDDVHTKFRENPSYFYCTHAEVSEDMELALRLILLVLINWQHM